MNIRINQKFSKYLEQEINKYIYIIYNGKKSKHVGKSRWRILSQEQG
jgi:hypothetical protein